MEYTKAINEIVLKRQQRLDAADALKQRLINSDAQFYENERRMRLAQIAIAKGETPDLDGLKAARVKLLKTHGLTEEDLAPPPECPLCGDTGLFDGKPCRCAVNIAASAQSGFTELALHSLKDVELSRYSDASRQLMNTVYDKTDKFIATFPNASVQNLIMIGSPGSGKTFLAGCVAGALLKNGYSVVSMTAFGFVNAMLSYHTTFNEDKLKYLSPVLDCDLLIIDDLGTETLLKNVTVEYLYLVLNERMNKGRHTLITTNLSKTALSSRYGERTASRLFDKKTAYVLTFPDEDLRNAVKKR